MDWLENMQTNLWIFPQGMERDGGMGAKGFKWTSQYGSVIASVYGVEGKSISGSRVSVPRGIGAIDQPNISSAIWRTVADQEHQVYFFENTFSPSLVWVKLNQIDFKPGSEVRKLALHGNSDLGVDRTANFKKAEPFKFLAPHEKRFFAI